MYIMNIYIYKYIYISHDIIPLLFYYLFIHATIKSPIPTCDWLNGPKNAAWRLRLRPRITRWQIPHLMTWVCYQKIQNCLRYLVCWPTAREDLLFNDTFWYNGLPFLLSCHGDLSRNMVEICRFDHQEMGFSSRTKAGCVFTADWTKPWKMGDFDPFTLILNTNMFPTLI